jgi:hypothetical protein
MSERNAIDRPQLGAQSGGSRPKPGSGLAELHAQKLPFQLSYPVVANSAAIPEHG